jgi:hypothetical protein
MTPHVDLRQLTKPQLQAMLVKLRAALQNVRDMQAQAQKSADEGWFNSAMADVCAFAGHVKGAVDILAAAAQFAPGGKPIATAYKGATAAIGVYYEHGVNRAASVGKLAEAGVEAFGGKVMGRVAHQSAQAFTGLTAGALETAGKFGDGKMHGGFAAAIGSKTELTPGWTHGMKQFKHTAGVAAAVIGSVDEFHESAERLHQNATEWQMLKQTNDGALNSIANTATELEIRIRQVDRQIARRYGS